MTATVTIPRGTWGVRILVLAIALVAGFESVRVGLGYYLASPATIATALAVDPGNADLMSIAADERLKTVQMGAPATALADYSRAILRRSPYEVVALRDIGIIAAANDDNDGADRLLTLAGRLSLRDYLTHAWLFDRRFRTGAPVQAIREADIVLRQQDANWDVVMPALVALTIDRRVLEPLAQALAANPSWRWDFLDKLGKANPAPANTYALLTRLQAIGAPPTKDELASYFRNIGDSLPPRELYRRWLALLPPTVTIDRKALVRDGDFSGADLPPPFGWTLFPSNGVYAELATEGPAGMGNSLHAAFSGDKYTVFASQQLALPPGRYRLSVRAYSETPNAAGTFAWLLACRTKGKEAELGRLALDSAPDKLARYQGDMVVPADCDRQELALVGMPTGTAFDSSAIDVDDVRLAALP